MPHTNVPLSADVSLPPGLVGPVWRTTASYEREIAEHRGNAIRLRSELIQAQTQLHAKDELIRQQEILNRECHHRLLNNIQMIVSILSLQSRTEPNPEAAARLLVAAHRVGAIAVLHRHLHSMDAVPTMEFKAYLEELCRDHSTMSMSEERLDRRIVTESIELKLPTETGTPLGLIVNELITNAIKHGKGLITVKLARSCEAYALSVYNDGSTLPQGFDPTACTGLGMNLVLSLAGQIGGELRFDGGDENEGTRFTVFFK
jgi:two-component sensor histidine kinase